MFHLSTVTSQPGLKLRPEFPEIVPESCDVSPLSSTEPFGKPWLWKRCQLVDAPKR